MATKYIVNNVTGQTINGETIQRPYKVYTALLTQSGGDNPDSFTGGSLSIGRTYVITNYQSGDDFTNVGAPSNSTGIKFVATGNTPSVWTNSSELSWNYGAPEVIILENTIGNIWFTYSQTGLYLLNSEIVFPTNKTVVQNTFTSEVDGTGLKIIIVQQESGTNFYIGSVFFPETPTDGILNNTSIEIRVYN